MSEDVRAGKMTQEEFHEAESCMHRSHGHCMTMGTASTMASMVEALGMSLPGNAAIPAVDARRHTLAQMTGRRIVEMVGEDLRMSRILTREAFENAIRTNAAIGGSPLACEQNCSPPAAFKNTTVREPEAVGQGSPNRS